MTRTATKPDWVWAGVSALAFALALTLMFELVSVPLYSDLILPRLPGFGFFEFFIEARRDSVLRGAVAWTATGLLMASLSAMAWRVRRSPAALVLLAGAAFVSSRSALRALALVRAGEGVSLAGPTLAFLQTFVLAACAAMAVLSAAGTRGRRVWGAAFIALSALPFLAPPRPRQGRASPPKRLVAVFGGADVEIREAEAEFSAPEARRSLFKAHEDGDALARIILLDNLMRAPDEPSNREMLDALADEARWRVGSRGAAIFARAYAHFSDAAKASYWQGKAGVPAGLLLGASGASRGVVRGIVSGLGPVTVALFVHDDPEAPYSLEPARLAASVVTDAQGRFRFENLASGYYFLAAVLTSRPSGRFKVKPAGDLRLDASSPVAEFRAEALR